MAKKVLIVANTDRHLNLCYLAYIKWFKDNGYIVDVATNSNKQIPNCHKKINIPITRTPFKISNFKAIKILRNVIIEEKYDLISTSTPMGGVVTRFAVRKIKNRPPVLYTAHGFHFFKGAPLINWLLYYPMEKYLSLYTDVLITINKEDYNFSKKHFKLKNYFIKGIGYHQNNFNKQITLKEKNALKKELGIKPKEYIISYIAEISKRKRQKYLVNTLKQMDLTNVKVLIVGEDCLNGQVQKLVAKYNLNEHILFLGFRNDINSILEISNLVISVSKQEGLPLNIMEAMAKLKPIIVTDCRGNRDLIKNNKNGLVVPINDQTKLIKAITKLKNNPRIAQKLAKENQKIVEEYELDNILPKYTKIYEDLLK